MNQFLKIQHDVKVNLTILCWSIVFNFGSNTLRKITSFLLLTRLSHHYVIWQEQALKFVVTYNHKRPFETQVKGSLQLGCGCASWSLGSESQAERAALHQTALILVVEEQEQRGLVWWFLKHDIHHRLGSSEADADSGENIIIRHQCLQQWKNREGAGLLRKRYWKL
jgi:hypothetical protein